LTEDKQVDSKKILQEKEEILSNLKQWKLLYGIIAGKTSSVLFSWIFGRAKE